MRRAFLPLVTLVVTVSAFAQTQYPFQNPNLPVEQRVQDLLSRMTLDEKIAAFSTNPSVPRLGVVGAGHVEGLHGLALGGPGHWEGRGGKTVIPTTQFPQARGLGQTWDPALLEEAAAVEGYETRYAFQSEKYQRGGLVVRAPNADLSRDPRWGRSEESYGEDPYLVGTLAVGFIHGLQGHDPKYWLTSSLMKHFLANSNEDNRDGSSSDFDDRLFHEYYSVPFRMGVEQGGSNAFMTSYNAWNHIPMTASPALKQIVMKDWRFNGIICTDAGALTNMVTHHHYSPDIDQAVASAVHAGINQFLDKYRDGLHAALDKKLVSESDLDENLKGVYRIMIHLGLLDPPSQVKYASIGKVDLDKGDPWTWPDRKPLVRRVTDESIVLLKNRDRTLPLNAAKLKSIAVVGEFADIVALDWYSGTPPYSVSPLEGIKLRAGAGVKVEYAKGDDVAAALKLATSSDVVIAIVGNHPTCNAGWNKCADPAQGKEAIDRKSLTLADEPLVERLLAANPRTIVVMNTSFPYAIGWIQEHAPAIVEMTHNSQEEGTGLADVLFGDYNPAGRLTQTWVASLDDLPPMMDYKIRHGRTYLYFKGKPLYAFGYGLSYTSFQYSNLRLSAARLKKNGSVNVSVDVKNTGMRAGDEVVQLYVKHIGSKLERPVEELRGFERISLKRGETKTVELKLPATALSYWNTDAKRFEVESDQVVVIVGASSDDIRLKKNLTVVP